MKKPEAKFNLVMLIDDNEIDNLINQKIIESSNFAERIFLYTGGKSAIESLQNIVNNDGVGDDMIPDLIFLDINMPLMDGFQFLEEYDKLPAKIKDSTQIVMLTTSINPVDKDRAASYPYIVHFLNKPLTKAYLESIEPDS